MYLEYRNLLIPSEARAKSLTLVYSESVVLSPSILETVYSVLLPKS